MEGTCQCVAGNGRRAACKHLAALCFALLDFDVNKLYEACTQRLQQWHHPTRKPSNPVNLLDINFFSLKHNKAEENQPKYLQFLQTDIYIPTATTTLRQLLVKYNQQSTAAASIRLSQPAHVRFISLPARVITGPIPPPYSSTRSPAFKYYMEHIYLSPIQISVLEETTKGQSTSVDWFDARRRRITSRIEEFLRSSMIEQQETFVLIGTNVHSISTHHHDFDKVAKHILQNRNIDLTSNLAIRHGILNEELCRRRYVTHQAKSRLR